MVVPISAAARITDVPSGTLMSWPSMVIATIVSLAMAGLVPRSISPRHAISLLRSNRQRGRAAEIFRKIIERAQHRIGREPAQRTERSVLHRIAQIAQDRDIVVDPVA